MYGELFLQKGYCTDPDQREFGEKFPFPFRAVPCLLLILHYNATYHTASHPHATMGLCHAIGGAATVEGLDLDPATPLPTSLASFPPPYLALCYTHESLSRVTSKSENNPSATVYQCSNSEYVMTCSCVSSRPRYLPTIDMRYFKFLRKLVAGVVRSLDGQGASLTLSS